MSRHDDRVRLMHMLDYAREAVELAAGKTGEDIKQTRVLQLALIRLVEVVGEAGAKISDETRVKIPEIPWLDVVGMRNRLIHGYDKIDFDILCKTTQKNLPELIIELKKALGTTGL